MLICLYILFQKDITRYGSGRRRFNSKQLIRYLESATVKMRVCVASVCRNKAAYKVCTYELLLEILANDVLAWA